MLRGKWKVKILRRKWKKWRKSENPLEEVSLEENIKPEKIIRSQSPRSRTGPPNTRGEANGTKPLHPWGSAETPDNGERGIEDGAERAKLEIGSISNYICGPYMREPHVIHNTKYWLKVLKE